MVDTKVDIRYVIGVDPGVNTGVAVYDRVAEKIIEVRLTDFWGCFRYITENYGGDTMIIVEVPVGAMYAKQATVAEGKSRSYGNRMMSNVAAAAREATLLVEEFGRKFIVKSVRPAKEKKSAAEVKRITGYQGSTNPHTRDAIMLCYRI